VSPGYRPPHVRSGRVLQGPGFQTP
jgi:hypothetical protein